MTTAPRPGAHVAAVRHTPDRLRADVEPLLAELDNASTDLSAMDTFAEVGERAHQVLIDGLSVDEGR